ncbi:hypothetical protein BD289DRAFT_444526, partial [Coniella lustricola]
MYQEGELYLVCHSLVQPEAARLISAGWHLTADGELSSQGLALMYENQTATLPTTVEKRPVKMTSGKKYLSAWIDSVGKAQTDKLKCEALVCGCFKVLHDQRTAVMESASLVSHGTSIAVLDSPCTAVLHVFDMSFANIAKVVAKAVTRGLAGWLAGLL